MEKGVDGDLDETEVMKCWMKEKELDKSDGSRGNSYRRVDSPSRKVMYKE